MKVNEQQEARSQEVLRLVRAIGAHAARQADVASLCSIAFATGTLIADMQLVDKVNAEKMRQLMVDAFAAGCNANEHKPKN